MMKFALGIILGGFFGVFADRLWQWFERRVRVAIVSGFSVSIHHKGRLQLTIFNKGSELLPEFQLLLFNRSWGTWDLFQTDDSGDLRPGEERLFKCSLIAGSYDKRHLESLTGSAPEAERTKATLRLVMSRGRTVLYENERVGTAVMKMLVAVAEAKSISAISGQDSWDACAQPESMLEWVRRLFRRRHVHPSTGTDRHSRVA